MVDFDIFDIGNKGQGHYGFHSFAVVDRFCLFIYLWVLTFPLEDCSEFGNFVITLISYIKYMVQAFLKKWWVESDFKEPNLPLSLRFKGSGCHYNSV
jgi:hypothetical protein